ncbi:hypothetical protein LguiA_004418 [Lonicera macranthoides]
MINGGLLVSFWEPHRTIIRDELLGEGGKFFITKIKKFVILRVLSKANGLRN